MSTWVRTTAAGREFHMSSVRYASISLEPHVRSAPNVLPVAVAWSSDGVAVCSVLPVLWPGIGDAMKAYAQSDLLID